MLFNRYLPSNAVFIRDRRTMRISGLHLFFKKIQIGDGNVAERIPKQLSESGSALPAMRIFWQDILIGIIRESWACNREERSTLSTIRTKKLSLCKLTLAVCSNRDYKVHVSFLFYDAFAMGVCAAFSIFSIKMPYPFVGSLISTWVTAPISLPSCMIGLPLMLDVH